MIGTNGRKIKKKKGESGIYIITFGNLRCPLKFFKLVAQRDVAALWACLPSVALETLKKP